MDNSQVPELTVSDQSHQLIDVEKLLQMPLLSENDANLHDSKLAADRLSYN